MPDTLQDFIRQWGAPSVLFSDSAILETSKAVKDILCHYAIKDMGIRYVGETTAKTLANNVEHLLDFREYSLEKLQEMEDVGIKVAESIYQFFKNPDNIRMLERLEKAGVNLKNNRQAVKKHDRICLS